MDGMIVMKVRIRFFRVLRLISSSSSSSRDYYTEQPLGNSACEDYKTVKLELPGGVILGQQGARHIYHRFTVYWNCTDIGLNSIYNFESCLV
jgi:hypothetical protein